MLVMDIAALNHFNPNRIRKAVLNLLDDAINAGW